MYGGWNLAEGLHTGLPPSGLLEHVCTHKHPDPDGGVGQNTAEAHSYAPSPVEITWTSHTQALALLVLWGMLDRNSPTCPALQGRPWVRCTKALASADATQCRADRWGCFHPVSPAALGRWKSGPTGPGCRPPWLTQGLQGQISSPRLLHSIKQAGWQSCLHPASSAAPADARAATHAAYQQKLGPKHSSLRTCRAVLLPACGLDKDKLVDCIQPTDCTWPIPVFKTVLAAVVLSSCQDIDSARVGGNSSIPSNLVPKASSRLAHP